MRRALRRSLAQVRHVTPVPPGAARGLVADVYARVERDFGMLAPPIALHSAAPEVMAGAWILLRESLLAEGKVPRATKEQVATEVSQENACPYCVDVHGATLRGLGGRPAASGPAASGPAASGTASGAVASGAASGPGISGSEVSGPSVSGPSVARGPETMAVALTFHYLNRMVNVFLGESPLPPEVPGVMRGGALRVLGAMMGSQARRSRPPGDSLDLLPEAPLPPDLAWASAYPHLAGAVARADAAMTAAGERSVPARVRELVTERLAAWDGKPPGVSRSWADEAVKGLPSAERPSGRLALLTALASYQAGPVAADLGKGDRVLLETTAWASLTAARARVR